MARHRLYLTDWKPVNNFCDSSYGNNFLGGRIWMREPVTELEWCLWEAIWHGRQGVRVHIEFQKQERECCLSVEEGCCGTNTTAN